VPDDRRPDSTGSSPEAAIPDRRTVALARVRKFVTTYVAKGKYELYPEPEVVENVVQGLADHLVAHGRMYCPCAPVEDSKTRGSDMVCPCTPHHEDIARQGYCDCALFASPDFVAGERLKAKKG
jgi:ferredoxin-thioredoxin reductase catalytic subunit